ncbi:MAG: hypothetical protein QF579_06605, partial [Dehalococcoidia bacterium]|nr:hypothetical protein [Dehalococcoidia bacterium]
MASESTSIGRGRTERLAWPVRTVKVIKNFVVRKPLGAAGGGIILTMICLGLAASVIARDPVQWF